MSKPLLINIQYVNNLLNTKDYTLLACYLKDVFKLERDINGTPLPFAFSKESILILLNIQKDVLREQNNDTVKDLSKELFRSLRNYVINSEVQTFLINNDDFLNDLNNIMIKLQTDQCYDTLQIVLQFLINMVISTRDVPYTFLDLFLKHIFNFLKARILVYEVSALLYNISLHKPLTNLNVDIYQCIFELYEVDNNVEYLHFLLESFIKYEHFWDYYRNFNITHRLILLDIIRHKQIEGKDLNLPDKGVITLAKQFIKSGEIIFQTVVSSESNLEPYEVSQLLEVISSLCSNEYYLKILQNNKDLLINCGVLLINIHNLGKESENCFSSIQKLNEIRQPNANICQHPAFGFKGNLIRIIGNLCWKNEVMQNLVREAELIPIILDCCNIDARNPFIIQWSILAIRNLCENNLKNQEIIAGMHQQGTVSSTTLEEMGLTLHSDGDNSLKIVSLEAIKNVK